MVIPARMESARLPGKVLADLGGRPLLQWVYERAVTARRVDAVFVATGDDRIAEAACDFGARVIRTVGAHGTGTERVAEAAREVSAEWIVNVQADEPFVDADVIDLVVASLEDGAEMATAMAPLTSPAEYTSPHVVKVVVDQRDRALYFSRAPVPYGLPDNEVAISTWRSVGRHIGIYGFKRDVLLDVVVQQPTELERVERLEQLRAMEAGRRIHVVRASDSSMGVDTPEDLQEARRRVEQLARGR